MTPAVHQTYETDLSWRGWNKDSRSHMGTVVPGDTYETTCEITDRASLSEETYVCPQIRDLQRAELEQLLLMWWPVTALESHPPVITLRRGLGTEEREGKQANELIINVISGLRDFTSNGWVRPLHPWDHAQHTKAAFYLTLADRMFLLFAALQL